MYYTSYFGNIKHIDKKYKLVSISASKPVFCGEHVEDWSFLGPSRSLLYQYKQGEITENEYTNIYISFLENNWENLKEFMLKHENDNIVMLCYEKPPKFCHRHLLAEFLNNNGIECEEFPYDI